MATRKTFDDREYIDHFWSGVQPSSDDSCWPWMRSSASQKWKYGNTSINGKTLRAHRVAFRLAFGYFPKVSCHSCDNPICCNPKHIIDGTHKLNVKHMLERGRTNPRRGSGSGVSIFTEEIVLEIRREREQGATYMALGSKYNAHHSTIEAIVKRRTWTHI